MSNSDPNGGDDDFSALPGDEPADSTDQDRSGDIDIHGPPDPGRPELVFGDPDRDSRHWHVQTEPYMCDPIAEASIYEAITGHHISEVAVGVESAQYGFLTTNGTSPEHVGRWLEMQGIECHENANGTFLDVIRELRDGNKVIVDVDSDTLWNSSDSLRAFHTQSADHAIWLTGVDASDPDHVKVIINDSGQPDGAGATYDLHDMAAVLNHPGFHYVATGHGPSRVPEDAPGYDEEAGVFSTLDTYIRDHLGALTQVGYGLGLAAASVQPRRRAASRKEPPSDQAEPHEGEEGENPEEPPRLPPPQARLEDMTRDAKDDLLREL